MVEIRDYAPIFARFGVGIVFFLFGISQLIYPKAWISWIPSYVTQLIDPIIFIYINGSFDLIIGLLLLIGFLTRISAFLGIMHLIGVIYNIGFNDISIRDFGLLLVLVSVLLNGPDKFCFDNKFKGKIFKFLRNYLL